MPRDIQPDDFVALDGSIQTLTAEDYAEAAAAMLDATEVVPAVIEPQTPAL